jgi:hypothetical protein
MKPARRSAHQPGLIPPRNRHLRQPTSPSLAAGPSAAPSRWDSWLSRGASISQIVGIGLALAGLFYTVIPLYQKAAVDEQLARREMELKTVETTLAEAKTETYRLRRDNYMRVATGSAADECSDVRRGFMPMPTEEAESERVYRLQLNIDMVECVDRYLAQAAEVKDLNPTDLKVWRAWATPMAAELEAQRQAARKRIAELPEKARADPSVLEPVGELTRRMDEILERGGAFRTPEQRQQRLRRLFAQQVESTQTHIAGDYRQRASTRLMRELEPKPWREERQRRERAARPSAPASAPG